MERDDLKTTIATSVVVPIVTAVIGFFMARVKRRDKGEERKDNTSHELLLTDREEIKEIRHEMREEIAALKRELIEVREALEECRLSHMAFYRAWAEAKIRAKALLDRPLYDSVFNPVDP